jgi:hypothetical protein
MTVEPGMPGLAQSPETGLMERIVQSRFGGALALSAVLFAGGIANLSRPARARADAVSVNEIFTVGTQPDANGNDAVTIMNNGTECVIDDFHLSKSEVSGNSSSSTTIDLSSTVQPGETTHWGIGPSAEGGNVSLNIYDCADFNQTNPLVPATNFIFAKGYNASIESGASSIGSGSTGSTTGSESMGGTNITITSSGSQITTSGGQGSVPSPMSGGENCVVPKTFRRETVQQAAKSLVRAQCQLGGEYHLKLTKRQKAEHRRLVVDGFALQVQAKVPRGHAVPPIMRRVLPGQVLPAGTRLFAHERLA